jgi:hypothetical protein
MTAMAAPRSGKIQKEILKQIKAAERAAERLEQNVSAVLRRTRDYDVERLLKNIDADMMDVRHNLSQARELMEARLKQNTRR